MRTLLEGSYDDGYKAGFRQGRRDADEAIRNRVRIENLRNVMSSLQVSLEAAMKILKFPKAKTDFYRKALESDTFQ